MITNIFQLIRTYFSAGHKFDQFKKGLFTGILLLGLIGGSQSHAVQDYQLPINDAELSDLGVTMVHSFEFGFAIDADGLLYTAGRDTDNKYKIFRFQPDGTREIVLDYIRASAGEYPLKGFAPEHLVIEGDYLFFYNNATEYEELGYIDLTKIPAGGYKAFTAIHAMTGWRKDIKDMAVVVHTDSAYIYTTNYEDDKVKYFDVSPLFHSSIDYLDIFYDESGHKSSSLKQYNNNEDVLPNQTKYYKCESCPLQYSSYQNISGAIIPAAGDNSNAPLDNNDVVQSHLWKKIEIGDYFRVSSYSYNKDQCNSVAAPLSHDQVYYEHEAVNYPFRRVITDLNGNDLITKQCLLPEEGGIVNFVMMKQVNEDGMGIYGPARSANTIQHTPISSNFAAMHQSSHYYKDERFNGIVSDGSTVYVSADDGFYGVYKFTSDTDGSFIDFDEYTGRSSKGSSSNDTAIADGRFGRVRAMAISQGHLYFYDQDNKTIKVIDTSLPEADQRVFNFATQSNYPSKFTSKGNSYVLDMQASDEKLYILYRSSFDHWISEFDLTASRTSFSGQAVPFGGRTLTTAKILGSGGSSVAGGGAAPAPAPNVAPVATLSTHSHLLLNNNAVTISLVDNVTDPDGDTISISLKSSPIFGSASLSSGILTYTPNANASMPTDGSDLSKDIITYEAIDDQGNISDLITLEILLEDADSDGVPNKWDDFPSDSALAFSNYTPALNGISVTYGSIAFEDLWPVTGDYDFNDVVVDYSFNRISNPSNQIVGIQGIFKIRALASYSNGIGLRLPAAVASHLVGDNVSVSLISSSGIQVPAPEINLDKSGVTCGDTILCQSGPVITISENHLMSLEEIVGTLILDIRFDTPVTQSALGSPPWDIFIWQNRNRTIEIHMPGVRPTTWAKMSLYPVDQDVDPANRADSLFKTKSGKHPWAIHTADSPYKLPSEGVDVTKVYEDFSDWAKSGGVEKADWFKRPKSSLLRKKGH